MICGNISNFFSFSFFLLLVWFSLLSFLFFFFFNLPPHSFVFGPLRIFCLKEIEAIETHIDTQPFYKSFSLSEHKNRKTKSQN